MCAQNARTSRRLPIPAVAAAPVLPMRESGGWTYHRKEFSAHWRKDERFPMSVFRRFSLVFQQKANAALDRVEDPNEALDLSYQKLLEQYQQVRRAVADVLTSQKRLEGQQSALKSQYDKLQGQARQALSQGQEDLARTALQRADVVKRQGEALGPQITQLQTQEGQLELTAQKLQAQVEAFRTQRETMKAQYTAAKASTKAVEGISGISEQMADVSLMLDRAKDKVSDMQARSAAVGELADTGFLDNLSLGAGGDDIDAQLRKGGGDDTDLQLAAMKAELGIGTGGSTATAQVMPQTSIGPAQSAAERPATGTPDQGGAWNRGREAAVAASSRGGPPSESPTAAAGGAGSSATGDRPGLVVRIVGLGQYEVPASIGPALDGLDGALSRAVDTSDDASFESCTEELTKLIKANGNQLSKGDVRSSDLIVPSPDMTLEEARALLSTKGDRNGDNGVED